MRLVTLFPETENVHLTKDVGMIPYLLKKIYNYDSTLVCYDNGPYNYLDNEVKSLKLSFLKKITGSPMLDGAFYLIKKSRSIDVLHLFHASSKRVYLWAIIYKFLNHEGFIYLKLDADNRIKDFDYQKKGIKGYIIRKVLRSISLITVETKALQKYINSNWNLKVDYLPNGFYNFDKRKVRDFSYKENTIITVGRIGTYQKATELLLEAFKDIHDILETWILKIIGPIEPDFEIKIANFFADNPKLKSKINFLGKIEDKKKLDYEYQKAKVFVLTSRFEGFPLVFLESIQAGCYIVTSEVDSAYDVTNNGKYGSIFPIGDVEKLKEYLIEICQDDIRLFKNYELIQDFAYENFHWPTILKSLNNLILLNRRRKDE
jgi:glycosyltransferase involved in cell wall biosynthesis